ncbi:hypothetical protein [Celerinatantimonas sp. MCCC 1A17872]|uniref:hypothetical protein n=1 Tax=Celerinatantimonas sp. MCCC 1A17872 TaxID=3177514 RepID=UPI0038BF8CF7
MQLMPLQMTAGWQVVWNHFYNVDVGNRLDDEGLLKYPFVEDILLLRNPALCKSIDLGWGEEGNPNSQYCLRYLSWHIPSYREMPKKTIERRSAEGKLIYELVQVADENWENPLDECYLSDRFAVADKINSWLVDSSLG